MAIIVGGDHVVEVDAPLAAAFEPGDQLLAGGASGELLHVPAASRLAAQAAVERASVAFAELETSPDDAITAFYEAFARRLDDDDVMAPVLDANDADVADARRRGRTTTRLVLDERARRAMVDGLLGWAGTAPTRGRLVETVEHGSWRVEQRTAGLGVVGFVFEGRPNVFADATGVLRGANTVVFRIGSDALGTARAVVAHVVDPALAEAGLPPGSVTLLDDASRAAGWALFADPRLGLAVARGSGPAVSQLGAVARAAGTAVSLHGTGGAWMVAGAAASVEALAAAVEASLDRKVCNTLNVCCVPADRADELVPVVLDALVAAGRGRGTESKLHVAEGSEAHVPPGWFDRQVPVGRAGGEVTEPRAETIAVSELGTEWEWEDSPEMSLAVVADVDEAIRWHNRWSPRLVASLISDDRAEHERFRAIVDAPFVGNGMTRWVDGQYALGRPELGLSNWEDGRLFGRGGVLSGDSVFTVRTFAFQDDPHLRRS